MKELLYKWFIGHNHKWEERSTHKITNDRNEVIGFVIILRCKECGKLKTFDVSDY